MGICAREHQVLAARSDLVAQDGDGRGGQRDAVRPRPFHPARRHGTHGRIKIDLVCANLN
jgi:hypothetical protein